jgi:hypothetical protein
MRELFGRPFSNRLLATTNDHTYSKKEAAGVTATLAANSIQLNRAVTVQIVPKGFSGAHCGSCGAYFTESDMDEVASHGSKKCTQCDEKQEAWQLARNVDLKESAVPHLTEEGVKAAVWYHSTNRADWATTVTNPNKKDMMVHVGTSTAALHRANHVDDDVNGNSDLYLYEVRVKPEAQFNPIVKKDLGKHVKSDSLRGLGEQNKVTRYLNSHEDPGSISLELPAGSFEITKVSKTPYFYDGDSPYIPFMKRTRKAFGV